MSLHAEIVPSISPLVDAALLRFSSDSVSEYADFKFFENQPEPQRLREAQGKTRRQTRVRPATQPVPLERRVWLNSRDAADYIGTTMGGLKNRVYRGQIKPKKPYGHLGRCMYKRMDLDRLMENSKKELP